MRYTTAIIMALEIQGGIAGKVHPFIPHDVLERYSRLSTLNLIEHINKIANNFDTLFRDTNWENEATDYESAIIIFIIDFQPQ